MYDGKCYLCRKGDYDQNNVCPVCGAVDPDTRTQALPKDTTRFKVLSGVDDENSSEFGYHRHDIAKGVLGERSKIMEEYNEFLDANEQGNSVMELVELSDLLGAIEAYSVKYYSIDLDTLLIMTRATQRSFKLGHRK
jgi:hypothetical protein